MSIKYTTQELNEIINLVRDETILLPNFQRDYVWKPTQQDALAISCILGLPIGSLLILEGKSNDFSSRNIAGLPSRKHKKVNSDTLFLLDGQQRTTSLKFIFDDPFSQKDNNWEEVARSVNGKLKQKYFIDISDHASGSDPFDLKELGIINTDSLEPSDLDGRIKKEKVNITGVATEQYHHPKKYQSLLELEKKNNSKSPEHTATYKIAQDFAEKKIIPLYSVFWTLETSQHPYALHIRVIELIANDRLEALKAELTPLDEEVILDFFEKKHTGLSSEIIEIETGEHNINKGWDELKQRWIKNTVNIFEGIRKLQIPSTVLPQKEISRAAAIFEELNNSGTKLSVFDLLVARAARSNLLGSDKTLPEYILQITTKENNFSSFDHNLGDWNASKEMGVIDGKSLSKKFQDIYLNSLSLISNAKELNSNPNDVKYIKKDKILSIEPENINKNTKRTVDAIIKTLAFLQTRCGISKLEDTPYLLMTLPIIYCLDDEDVFENPQSLKKIELWYWDALFTGRYRERQNERCVQDVERLYNWVKNDVSFYPEKYSPQILCYQKYNDLDTLLLKDIDNLPGENITKSILQFVLSQRPDDFSEAPDQLSARKVSLSLLKLEEHHIVPLGSATSMKQSTSKIRNDKKNILNSPLNLTLISDKANNKISNLPVTEYIHKCNSWAPATHFIPNNLDKQSGETDELYYERLLTDRYACLKQAITVKLSSLR